MTFTCLFIVLFRSTILSQHCGNTITDGEKYDPMFMKSSIPQGTHTSSCGHPMHSDCWQGCVLDQDKIFWVDLFLSFFLKLSRFLKILRQGHYDGATTVVAFPKLDRHRELRIPVSVLQMPLQHCDSTCATTAHTHYKVCTSFVQLIQSKHISILGQWLHLLHLPE